MKGDHAVRTSWHFSVEGTHPQARRENEAGADVPQDHVHQYLKEVKPMTNTLKAKIIMAIWDFADKHPHESIHGVSIHHYGNNYRIETMADTDRIVIFRHNPHDIRDDLIAKATVADNGGVTIEEV